MRAYTHAYAYMIIIKFTHKQHQKFLNRLGDPRVWQLPPSRFSIAIQRGNAGRIMSTQPRGSYPFNVALIVEFIALKVYYFMI